MISALILAAGTSSRLGRPKPLADLGGKPLLAHVLGTVQASEVNETIVVLGPAAERIRQAIPLDGVTVVTNPAYREGMSTSLRAGLSALNPAAEGVLVVLGDQPFLAPHTLDALMGARSATEARILIPTFQGVRGNPVLLDRSLVPEAAALSGDVGCRALFGDHREDILEVPVEDPGILLDIDTEHQLARLHKALERGEPLEALIS